MPTVDSSCRTPCCRAIVDSSAVNPWRFTCRSATRGKKASSGSRSSRAIATIRAAKPPYKDVYCRPLAATDRRDRERSKLLPSVDLDDFVPIEGVVHHVTDLGIFLEIGGRRVFVGRNCMESLVRPPKPGETVTLRLYRWYARQEALE